MTRVELRRLDDGFPPRRELLFIEADGSFQMWRSNAETVGRFAGIVPDSVDIAGLIDAAAGDEPPPGRPPDSPDAVEDELRVDGRSFATRPTDQGSGTWGALLRETRGLLSALLDQPAAAIRLEVPIPTQARLVHVGHDVLPIELGSLTGVAEVYRDTARLAASSFDPVALRHVDAGPGWATDLAIAPLEVPADAMLLVRLAFVADDDGIMVPVEVSRARYPPDDQASSSPR